MRIIITAAIILFSSYLSAASSWCGTERHGSIHLYLDNDITHRYDYPVFDADSRWEWTLEQIEKRELVAVHLGNNPLKLVVLETEFAPKGLKDFFLTRAQVEGEADIDGQSLAEGTEAYALANGKVLRAGQIWISKAFTALGKKVAKLKRTK